MMTSRKKRKKRVEWFGQQLPLFNIGLWLALSLVGGLLPKASGGEAPGSITTTAYPSGVSCGTNPQVKCLTKATCSKFGVCNCPASTYGEGYFQCYPGNSIRAEVTSTTLKTFRNTSGKIIWPCRYRLTDFTTIRSNSGQKCHFKVFGSNQVIGGKVRISGFEVRMQLLEGSKEIGGIGIRKDGRAQNHVFTYTERGQNGFVNESPVTDEDMGTSDDISTGSGSGDGGDDDDDEHGDGIAWGPPEDLDIGNGERVVCKVDLDNFATVDVPSCGTRVSFRAASVDETQQDQVSGLSVSISQSNGPITFNNPETYLAETKKKGILRKSAKQKNISLNQEILHQAMAYAAKQYSTPEGRECEDTARTYRSYCRSDSQRANALKTCSFILEDEQFIGCMDPSRGVPSSNSVSALRLCLWYTCSPSRTVCSVLQDRIQRKSCIHLTPTAFFARDCNA